MVNNKIIQKPKSQSFLRLGCRLNADVNALIASGDEHFKAERWEQARQDYEAVLALNPDDVRSNLRYGRLLAKTGRPAEAAGYFERVLAARADDPNIVEVAVRNLLVLGDAHLSEQRWEEAQEAYEAASRLKVDDPRIDLRMGELLARTGRRAEAMHHLVRAAANAPEDQKTRSAAARNLIALGDGHCEEEGWEEARSAYEAALALSPDDGAANLRLGRLLARIGRRDEAVACFARGLSRKPDNSLLRSAAVQNLLALGDEHCERESWEGALHFYESALAIGPEEVGVNLRLGRLLARTGRREDAAAFFDRVLSAEPVDREHRSMAVRNLLALGDEQLEGDRMADARKTYERVLAISADDPEVNLRMGHLLLADGSRLEAAVHFDRAVSNTSASFKKRLNGAMTLLSLRESLLDKGRAEDAQMAYEVALTLNPAIRLHTSSYGARRPYRFASTDRLDGSAIAYLSADRAAVRKDIAFFSCVAGGYDPVTYHEFLQGDADYFFFTDERVSNAYITHVRPLPYYCIDPTRSARYVKTHPHVLFPGHRIAIWLDGNILVRGDLSEMIARFEASGLPVGAIPHPARMSVYGEADICASRNKDDVDLIQAQVFRYRQEGFECDDLIESNLMMFRLDHPLLPELMAIWWAEIDRGSRRDQLSFNYALRRTGADYFRLMERPDSVRNHPALAIFEHGSGRSPYRPMVTRLSRCTSRSYSAAMAQRLAAQEGRRVDVVVCVHNALDSVAPCLESVAAHRDPAVHRILVVNDGSGAETSAWLESFAARTQNVDILHRAEPGGYTVAANTGIRALHPAAEMAILLNSDTIVAGAWIGKLLDAASSHPKVGIVGPLSNAASHQSIPNHKGTGTQTAINDLPAGYDVAAMNAWCEENSPEDVLPHVPLVHGFCFGITRELVDAIGFFDASSFPFGFGEENDYCFRATDAGFSLLVATHTYVYHEKSQSYGTDRRHALSRAGSTRLRELHGAARVERAIGSMQDNPYLDRIRRLAAAQLY